MFKAAEEYITARCIEVLDNESHKQASERISNIEKKLIASMTKNQLGLFWELMNEKDNLFTADSCELYKAGFNDRISLF